MTGVMVWKMAIQELQVISSSFNAEHGKHYLVVNVALNLGVTILKPLEGGAVAISRNEPQLYDE